MFTNGWLLILFLNILENGGGEMRRNFHQDSSELFAASSKSEKRNISSSLLDGKTKRLETYLEVSGNPRADPDLKLLQLSKYGESNNNSDKRHYSRGHHHHHHRKLRHLKTKTSFSHEKHFLRNDCVYCGEWIGDSNNWRSLGAETSRVIGSGGSLDAETSRIIGSGGSLGAETSRVIGSGGSLDAETSWVSKYANHYGGHGRPKGLKPPPERAGLESSEREMNFLPEGTSPKDLLLKHQTTDNLSFPKSVYFGEQTNKPASAEQTEKSVKNGGRLEFLNKSVTSAARKGPIMHKSPSWNPFATPNGSEIDGNEETSSEFGIKRLLNSNPFVIPSSSSRIAHRRQTKDTLIEDNFTREKMAPLTMADSSKWPKDEVYLNDDLNSYRDSFLERDYGGDDPSRRLRIRKSYLQHDVNKSGTNRDFSPDPNKDWSNGNKVVPRPRHLGNKNITHLNLAEDENKETPKCKFMDSFRQTVRASRQKTHPTASGESANPKRDPCYTLRDILIVIGMTSLVNLIAGVIFTFIFCCFPFRDCVFSHGSRMAAHLTNGSFSRNLNDEDFSGNVGCLEACLPDISYQRHIARGFSKGRGLRVAQMFQQLKSGAGEVQRVRGHFASRRLRKDSFLSSRRSLSMEDLSVT